MVMSPAGMCGNPHLHDAHTWGPSSRPCPGRIGDADALDAIAARLREAGSDSDHRRVLREIAAYVRLTGRPVKRTTTVVRSS